MWLYRAIWGNILGTTATLSRVPKFSLSMLEGGCQNPLALASSVFVIQKITWSIQSDENAEGVKIIYIFYSIFYEGNPINLHYPLFSIYAGLKMLERDDLVDQQPSTSLQKFTRWFCIGK